MKDIRKDLNIKSFDKIDELLNINWEFTSKNKNGRAANYIQNIITFDTETTSLFTSDFVTSTNFNKDHDATFYENAFRFGILYVWQCAIEDGRGGIKVFSGRTYPELSRFLQILEQVIWARRKYPTLSSITDIENKWNSFEQHKTAVHRYKSIATVYVHNFGFDFQFLRNLLGDNFATQKGHKRANVFARESRKPLYADLNMESIKIKFKDSFVLTNKSLKRWCKDSDLPVGKNAAAGDDYSKIRTPLTPLTQSEIEYCINDVVSMIYGIEIYRKRYETLQNIPLTQTGRVRREFEPFKLSNPDYCERCTEINASIDFGDFKMLNMAFAGGWAHGNRKYVNRLVHNVISYDFKSSYPYSICSFKYPMSKWAKAKDKEKIKEWFKDFKKVSPNSLDIDYCYLFKVRFTNVITNHENTFWSVSKTISSKNAVEDNGKIFSCEECEIFMTGLDFDMFTRTYDCDYEILELWRAKADFFPVDFLKIVFKFYAGKTEYKGKDDLKSIYMEMKEMLNSIYGMMVTAIIKDTVNFELDLKSNETIDETINHWEKYPVTEDDYAEMIAQKTAAIEKEDASKMDYLTFSQGIFVTAYSRYNLWSIIDVLDKKVVCGDTDSAKGIFDDNDLKVIEEYNEDVLIRENEVAARVGFNPELYCPMDKKGNKHHLGIFDREDFCEDFKTLGAKRYCFKADGKIHVTVAGLPKSNALQLINEVDDFRDGLFYDTDVSGKLMATYCDNGVSDISVIDYLGNEYITTEYDKYSVNLCPTTFLLSQSETFKNFLASDENIKYLDRTFLEF